jgi:hypothetical protein
MVTKTKARFPNTDYFEDIIIDISKFKPVNEFKDEIFGWYEGIYISILKTTISNNVIEQGDKGSI